MEELSKWMQGKEDDLKDFDYSEPPVLSPVAAMNCDKVPVPSDSVKHSDLPPPPELAILPHTKFADVPSASPAERDEGKRSSPSAKQNHLKYQFQLRPCHAVKGKQKLFRCDICDGIYRHAFSLKRHFLRTHINYIYLSEADKSNCNITASAINSNHRSTNLKGLDASHWPPNNSSDSPSSDQNDKRQHDFPFLFSCYSCQEYFHQQDELKTHVDNHVPVVKQKEFRCEKCKLTFTLKKNLRRHMAIHDSGRTFICKYCSKQFFTLASHKMHERIHEGKKSHRCSHCTASFIHYDNLKEHVQFQHGAYYHPCNVCSKFFDTEELLTLHAEEHMELSVAVKLNGKATTLNYENDSSDYCREATQLFESPSSFDYTCTVCGKKFLTYVNMCRHHRLAHQSSPKKRGRPQKSKVPRQEVDCRIVNNEITANSEAEFYNNIADKISDNLVNFIDGKYLDLEQYCSNNNTFQLEIDTHLNVPWHCYNFPPNFDYSKVELSESESEIDSNIERNSEDLLSDSFYSGNESDTANLSNDVFEECSGKGDDQNCEIEIGDNVACGDKSIGQNIPLTYICCACVERFSSLVAIEEHKINNHPNVFCTHIEIEGEKNIPPELCQQFCSPIGIFKRYIVPSLNCQQNDGLACTKCKKIFKLVSDLHLHILECGGGSNFKAENTIRRRSMRKKKLRQGMKLQNNCQAKSDVDLNNAHIESTSSESIEALCNSTLPANDVDSCPQEVVETSNNQLKSSVENSEISTSLEKETLETQVEDGNVLMENVDKIQRIESDVGNVEVQEIKEYQVNQSPCTEVKEDINQMYKDGDEKELDSSFTEAEGSTEEACNKNDVQLHLLCIVKETKENQPIKPYICKECKKSFYHSLTFDRHKKGCRHRVPLGRNADKAPSWKDRKKIRSFSCPYCKHSFIKLINLKNHMINTCYKKKKRKLKKKLLNYKKMNLTSLADAKLQYSDKLNQHSVAENSEVLNRELQIITKNSENESSEPVKDSHFETEEKQFSVNTQINESTCAKTDLTLETDMPPPFKQIRNTGNVQDELSAATSNEIKSENSTSRELFPEHRTCPHCFRAFAYLANYRRHVKEVCPVKKQLAKEIEGNGVKLRSPVPIFATTTCTVKGKIEDSVIGLLRDQSRQSEMMRASEPEYGGPAPSPRFRTFSCNVCHKIFLSFVKMLQHRLSHKLQSDESEDLPKLDIGLIEKLQENSTIDSSFEQQNAQEILNNLDNYLIKASEDELERAEQNIVMLSNQSGTDSLNQTKSNIESKAKPNSGTVKNIHSCEVCNKSFSSSASKLKHYKIAHKRTIPRRIKGIKENSKRIFKHSSSKPKSRSSDLPASTVNRVKRFGKKRTNHSKEKWHKT